MARAQAERSARFSKECIASNPKGRRGARNAEERSLRDQMRRIVGAALEPEERRIHPIVRHDPGTEDGVE